MTWLPRSTSPGLSQGRLGSQPSPFLPNLVFYVFPLLSIAMLTWAVLRLRQHAGNRSLQRAALWVSIAAVVISVGLFTLRLIRVL